MEGDMVVKVKRETVAACMTCPLCDKLLRDATTISECLHTFCRKCIYEKITEDEIESCPVCNIDLGGTPLEKLRPDHNLQDLRAKIFPLQRKKVKAPEIVSLPGRRKEISISSLVVSTPKVSEKAGTTGRRSKAVARKESRGSASLAERSVKNEGSFGDDTQNRTQSYAESFSNKENKDDDEPWDSKLDFLVEVANRTKPLKSGLKSEQKIRCKREDEKSNNAGVPRTSETATPKRLRRTQRKRSAATTTFGGLGNSPQQDEPSAKRERRNGPVWFSLVASSDQEGETSLPQIPANFLRIRDGNIPVSFIQKYLMGKLDLESETEIEIRCMGEAVIPALKLQKLVDLWLQRSPKRQRLNALVGSSAKDYMMVLVYARKLPDCNK
uniref:E3 ubiquitin protein ligase DRIP1 n=1 Tax=Noccaea caerulescens TaxID=107243 RepID=A0A1J3F918_NOCCA